MKIKKLLSGLTAMLMIVSMTVYLPISASAASSGSCGDTATYEFDDNGVLTISGTGEVDAFSLGLYRSSAKKIIVNEGITSIADSTFSNFTSLTEVTLPTSLTSIGDSAFSTCSELTSVIISGNVKIGSMAFGSCKKEDLVIDIRGVLTSLEANPRLERNDAFRNVKGTIKVHDQASFDLIKEYDPAVNVVLVSSVDVDTNALDKVIESARKYTSSSSFTAESYTALTEAIKAGEAAKEEGNANQTNIDNAAKAIRDAVAGLVKADDSSNTPIKSKIDEANGLLMGSYTTPSIEALKAAIKTAQEVYDKITSEDLPEESELISALDTLTKAMTIDETGEAETGLKKTATSVEWANFQNANNGFPKENNNTYTEDSWAKYMEAYQAYLDAKAKGAGNFTGKQLTEILDAVNKAKSELKALPPKTEAFEAEKKKYEDIINAKDSPYTKDSLEDLKEFCDIQINGILDENGDLKEGVNQADVDSATRAIENYINRLLVEKGDITELEKLAEECKPLIESDYTLDSWTTLAEKLATAQALVDDPDNAGKEAVATATEELKVAKDHLVIDYSEGEKTPGIVTVKTGGTSAIIDKGTADESMAGATKVRVTFDCAPTVSFNAYASIEITALVGGDNNFNKFIGANSNPTGAKDCSVTLDLANAIKAGDSYTVSASTYAWESVTDYVYAVTKVEYLDASGKVLKTFTGGGDTAKLDNFKTAIEDAKALIDSGNCTKDSVTALQAAVDAAEAVLKDTDKPLPSQMEAPKAALDSAIEAVEYLPADYTAVDEAIAKVPADLSIYTDESVKALNDAIEAVVEGKNITEQETVDGYAKAIEDAIAALVENPKGSIGGTLAIPGADVEVAVTVATADGEVVAEATAANGEYSILDLEDGDYVITFAADGFVARSYAVTVAGGNVSLEAEIHLYGDVNGDGEITTADAGIANAHARQVAILEGYDFDVAEVTGDGKVTTADFGAINAQAQGIK